MRFATDPLWLMRALWTGFALIWLVGALGAKRTIRRPGRYQYWPHLLAMWLGAALMLGTFQRVESLRTRLWSSADFPVLALVLTALGLGFAVWARIHIGRYWSGAVGSKAEHRLIQSGPYARLRHPIYTGISLALLGSVIAEGTVHALLGAAILIAALAAKSRREEAWLTQEFGDAYSVYRSRSWALVPFLY
jgi:protein-S-isoprenylcysteine O-methyltransferase Ste14